MVEKLPGCPVCDGAQEADAFRSAQLPKHDAIGTQTESCLQQFVRCHLGLAQFAFHGDEPDTVLAGELQLGRVLDQNHTLMHRNFRPAWR